MLYVCYLREDPVEQASFEEHRRRKAKKHPSGWLDALRVDVPRRRPRRLLFRVTLVIVLLLGVGMLRATVIGALGLVLLSGLACLQTYIQWNRQRLKASTCTKHGN